MTVYYLKIFVNIKYFRNISKIKVIRYFKKGFFNQMCSQITVDDGTWVQLQLL